MLIVIESLSFQFNPEVLLHLLFVEIFGRTEDSFLGILKILLYQFSSRLDKTVNVVVWSVDLVLSIKALAEGCGPGNSGGSLGCALGGCYRTTFVPDLCCKGSFLEVFVILSVQWASRSLFMEGFLWYLIAGCLNVLAEFGKSAYIVSLFSEKGAWRGQRQTVLLPRGDKSTEES